MSRYTNLLLVFAPVTIIGDFLGCDGQIEPLAGHDVTARYRGCDNTFVVHANAPGLNLKKISHSRTASYPCALRYLAAVTAAAIPRMARSGEG